MISKFSDECCPESSLKRVRDIFSLTSKGVSGLNVEQRDEFFYNWAGCYIERAPDQTLLVRNGDKRIVGYLVGCLDSARAGQLCKRIFYYKAFLDLYDSYPGHFHINCDPEFQQMGFGRQLVKKYLHCAQNAGLTGVHLVTGINASNRRFYHKLGFADQYPRIVEGRSLVLLGQRL